MFEASLWPVFGIKLSSLLDKKIRQTYLESVFSMIINAIHLPDGDSR